MWSIFMLPCSDTDSLLAFAYLTTRTLRHLTSQPCRGVLFGKISNLNVGKLLIQWRSPQSQRLFAAEQLFR